MFSALPRVGGMTEGPLAALLVDGALSDDAEIRHAAINGLLGNRPASRAAVPPLSKALLSDSLPRRQRAALALGRMGAEAKPAIPALIECARREPQEPAYGDALAAIGPPAIQPLVDQIATKGTPAEHEWIFKALRGMGAPAVGPLTVALASPNPAVRAGAASAFTGMSISAPPTIKALVALVGDKEPTVRAAALRAVGGIRSEQANVLPKVEAALADPSPQVRQAAAAALAAMGAVGKLGVDGLLELLKDPDVTTQRNTLQSIGGLGTGAAKAVPALIARLDQAETRVATITALGQIGEPAKPAVPKLIGLLENGPDEEKLAAARALTGIGSASAPALPVLYKSLKAPNRDVQIVAVEALIKIEPDDEKLLPVILPLATGGNVSGAVRRAAIGGLKRFGDKAQPAVPTLLKMLDLDNERSLAHRRPEGDESPRRRRAHREARGSLHLDPRLRLRSARQARRRSRAGPAHPPAARAARQRRRPRRGEKGDRADHQEGVKAMRMPIRRLRTSASSIPHRTIFITDTKGRPIPGAGVGPYPILFRNFPPGSTGNSTNRAEQSSCTTLFRAPTTHSARVVLPPVTSAFLSRRMQISRSNAQSKSPKPLRRTTAFAFICRAPVVCRSHLEVRSRAWLRGTQLATPQGEGSRGKRRSGEPLSGAM